MNDGWLMRLNNWAVIGWCYDEGLRKAGFLRFYLGHGFVLWLMLALSSTLATPEAKVSDLFVEASRRSK